MALYFDILKLEALTNGDPEYLVIALEHWFNKRTIPKNVYQKYKPLKQSIAGFSFLLNPLDLFNDKSIDILYKAQYVRLAGRRDYLLYKNYGIKYLDLNYFPDVYSTIQLNPLFYLKQNKLHFKYEEK